MKEIQYKQFSWRTHKKNWIIARPNVCQFELTFKCGLHCKHCYSDCYNKEKYIKKELSTGQVKFLLDKIYDAGIIWLCFTGGDPLTRKDFQELYSYAKDKGFLITIFTNAFSMTGKIADHLKKKPPFAIEITLNAVTKKTYEYISQVKGSFEKVMDGIKLITRSKLPLKIKTQITKDNLGELPIIRKFVENLGLSFMPSAFLHARFDGDLTPCSLRISLREVLKLDGSSDADLRKEKCASAVPVKSIEPLNLFERNNEHNNYLFSCAIGGGGEVNIDPFGNIIPCNCVREPKINLLEENFGEAHGIILNWIRTRTFTGNSKCRNCPIRELCYNCPGKALLETGNSEEPVEWFCKLARLAAKRQLLKGTKMTNPVNEPSRIRRGSRRVVSKVVCKKGMNE